jgi:hypothetical protein
MILVSKLYAVLFLKVRDAIEEVPLTLRKLIVSKRLYPNIE